jgi:endonuclease/exonuclease/phosphatase family metal-dependent hydrolase
VKTAVLVLLGLLAGTATGMGRSRAEPVVVRVMTFNIWHGGGLVDFGQVIAAVRAADPDLVGLQEAEGNTRRVADSLGWRYADERHQIISRLPLLDPPGGDGVYLLVEVRPGRVVAVANLHLTSDPYGPEAVRDGAPADSVLALERAVRLPEIRRHLAELPRLVAAGIPVILTGDFNTPSHRDWTRQVAAARPQVRYPLEWPVTAAVERAGFLDSYRQVHPDPVRRPGLTWTPGYPHPKVPATETHDRIDLIYAAGPASPAASRIVGEPGGPDVDVAVSPWPSDHRAVVTTFRVVPAVPPVLVAVGRRVLRIGDSMVVRYFTAGSRARVAILGAGSKPGPAVFSPATEDGRSAFATDALDPGQYEVALLEDTGRELARVPVTLLASGAVPEVSVARTTFRGSEPIGVGWRQAPGNRWDWVGVYREGEADSARYLAWRHTGATISGEMVLGPDAFAGPLSPGRYEVRLMEDDGYRILATAGFGVSLSEEPVSGAPR